MGCNQSTSAETQPKSGAVDDSRIGFGQSMHSGILRVRKMNVFEKYETMEVLGQGSMGYVQRVQVKEGTEGGSAVDSSRGQRLSERRVNKVDYALKQIQLDKVRFSIYISLYARGSANYSNSLLLQGRQHFPR